MSGYKIPKKYLKGFELLSKLDKTEFEKLISIIANKSLIGMGIDRLAEELLDVISPNSNDDYNNGFELSQTIFSYIRLCQDDDVQIIIKDLLNSFKNQLPDAKDEAINFLNKALLALADSSNVINLTLKIQDIKLEYPNVYLDSRIMTDIRVVFEDNIQSDVKNAVIIHNLKLEFDDDNSEKSIFISLDRSELIDLRHQIDRALDKEESLLKTNDFNFIVLND